MTIELNLFTHIIICLILLKMILLDLGDLKLLNKKMVAEKGGKR
jgi:hypothetical protein